MFVLVPAPPADYQIVEVQRHSVFAGKLGDRVSEDLVLERAGTRVLVHVAGSYHTLTVHSGSRFHVGDTVTVRSDVREGATVARDRIRKA